MFSVFEHLNTGVDRLSKKYFWLQGPIPIYAHKKNQPETFDFGEVFL